MTIVRATLLMIVVFAFAACEPMVEDPDSEPPVGERCDADPDWYFDLPIVTLRIGGDMNPPLVPGSDPDEQEADWSALETIIERYEGQIFTEARFKQLQRDLFATGLLQDGDRKWGFEFYAIPDLPRRGETDPRIGTKEGGCLAVRLDGEAATYYPQEVVERPLRLVR